MELKELQESLSIADQITNLKEIGLIIEDEALAASFLNDVSYYRFVKAYSLGLKAKNGKFNKGVTFKQLMELYLFNANFRQLLFGQIEHIEVNLRCRVSNYFSTTYGALSYSDSSLFADADYHAAFMNDMEEEIIRNKRAPFIRNFQENYIDGRIPLYALVEICSFGTLSKFFKNLKNYDKKAVAKSYKLRAGKSEGSQTGSVNKKKC
ncbi:MAG: Abi family protein [Lachnospiraceae bacterium]|nr:Abi family protein [Lachnospiraceae bacterium]